MACNSTLKQDEQAKQLISGLKNQGMTENNATDSTLILPKFFPTKLFVPQT